MRRQIFFNQLSLFQFLKSPARFRSITARHSSTVGLKVIKKKSALLVALVCAPIANADILLPSKFADQNVSVSWSSYTQPHLREELETDFELNTLGAMYQSELNGYQTFFGAGFVTDAKRTNVFDSSFQTSGDTGYILAGGVSGELSQYPARWFVSGAMTEVNFGEFFSTDTDYSGLNLSAGISSELELSPALSISGLALIRLLDEGDITSGSSLTWSTEKDSLLGARLSAHYTLASDLTVSGTLALLDGEGFEIAVQRELY